VNAPTADREGFTDATGRRMTYEAGIRNAARCIRDQGDVSVIEELIRWNMSPDEVLEWLVYPDTGEFADPIGVSE
jgi:hypothetical protein